MRFWLAISAVIVLFRKTKDSNTDLRTGVNIGIQV